MISRFLLGAKHWQVFLAFLALLLVERSATEPAVATASISMSYLSLLARMLPGLCYWIWFWALGSVLNSIVHPELRPRRVVFLTATTFVGLFATLFEPMILVTRMDWDTMLTILYFSLFFLIFFECYVLYFLARNLVLAETTRPVSFRDFIGSFLLFWFYPIGIWFLQPRINRLYAETMGTAQEAAPN